MAQKLDTVYANFADAYETIAVLRGLESAMMTIACGMAIATVLLIWMQIACCRLSRYESQWLQDASQFAERLLRKGDRDWMRPYDQRHRVDYSTNLRRVMTLRNPIPPTFS